MTYYSTCRQINGCTNGVNEIFHGTKGQSFTDQSGTATITDLDGNTLFSFEDNPTSPYVQEHKDLITAIRQDLKWNQAEETAISVMVAIMGRVSAYTGKDVTFEEMMNSDLKLGPDTYIMGDVGYIKNAKVPVPGSEKG